MKLSIKAGVLDGLRIPRPPSVGAFAAVMILALAATEARAQSVAGRVLDAVAGNAIADVTVELRNQVGARLDVAVTDREGRFRLTARGGGEHRLEARHLSYQPTTSDPFDIKHGQQVIVDLLLAPSPMEMEPLRITGRRTDPRHLGTLEGLYARAEVTPPVGPARVIAGDALRRWNGPQLKELFRWEMPFSDRRRSCTVMYWNGSLVGSAMAVNMWLETSVEHFEGVEFYTDLLSAPMAFRDMPIYLQDNVNCRIVVLWARR